MEPYLAKNPEAVKDDIILAKVIDYDSIFDLNFYTNCFMESMRIEPAVANSTTC